MPSQLSFLIAEDDVLVGRVLCRTLKRHGHVELVTTIDDARKVLAKESFVAIIADVGLPDGSGLDLIAEARLQHPALTALIVSGAVDERRLAQAHRLDASYLLKPIDTRELVLFAVRMGARRDERHEKIARVVARWTVEYGLTPAEASALQLAAHGVRRAQIAEQRGTLPVTLKKQIQHLIDKTGDRSLESGVSRLLRSVIDDGA